MGISAVITDLHSNLHALNAVMDIIEAKGCDEILCLVNYYLFQDLQQ